nr:MAG TPA: hypothetical protein [Caudoviricetes sp.]
MHGSNGSRLLMDSEQLILIFERDKIVRAGAAR